ncbi:hypothetical protein Pla175_27420 [Pirellulimonas nuda]|uniref:PEP-CTERM protein-sorting domain-containing protein n=2 Tax=Pirellulimonas nuda TaxID=2528009 RepID=A0A518DD24_9BACT|nr:hypothetical protein Pla175_27420 [Pirellulimonas nuda]
MRALLLCLVLVLPAANANALSDFGTIDIKYLGQASGLSAANGGRFNWEYKNLNSSSVPASRIESIYDTNKLFTFCVELGETILGSGFHTYTIRNVTDGPLDSAGTGFGAGATMSDAQATQVELLSKNYLLKAAGGTLAGLLGSGTNAQAAGSFQLAVWEIVFGDGNANTALGGTTLDNDATIKSNAQALLDSLVAAGSLAPALDVANLKVLVLTNSEGNGVAQDQLIVVAVPEMASIMTWACLTGVLGVVARRRRAAAA